MVGQSGAILYLIPQIIYCFKTITCSMAPLHSTVDGLKMKIGVAKRKVLL